MRELSEETGEFFQATQLKDWFQGWNPKSWFSSLLNSMGLTGWGKWPLNIGLILLCGFLFLMIGLATVRCRPSPDPTQDGSLQHPSDRAFPLHSETCPRRLEKLAGTSQGYAGLGQWGGQG